LGPVGRESRWLAILRQWWNERRTILRVLVAGLILGVVIAIVTPNRYESTVRLMPPDSQMSGTLGMVAALAQTTGGGATQIADLMPMKSTGALFLGVLRSRTVQDRLIERFDLRRVYRQKLTVDARKK